MNQTLKIAIPVGVLMAVIFGVTFFAQYTPRGDEDDKRGSGGGEPPLRFYSMSRQWNPDGSLQDRIFPGFYERRANESGTPNAAAFWFENRNPKAVRMQLKGVSCNACSGARVAPVPPAVARDLLRMTGVSVLPHGLFAGAPLGLAGPAAGLADLTPDRQGYGLDWKGAAFKDDPRAEYVIPAADNPDGWTPRWGILELQFSVGAEAQKTLTAEFDLQVEGTRQAGTARFDIAYEGADPFSLSRDMVDVGVLPEDAEPRTAEVLVYSSTRGPDRAGPGDLPPPNLLVQMPAGTPGDPGPVVSASAPARVPDADLPALQDAVSAQLKRPVRVLSAYRFTVTVDPRAKGQAADLGPLERDVKVSPPHVDAKTVRVRGSVRGGVWLDNDQTDIKIPTYPFARGSTGQEFEIVIQNPDAELALVPNDPATPDFLRLDLKKQKGAADLGSYKLTVTVPGGKKAGPWAGHIVLELKGAKPQRIRIPVRGNGTQ